jgi:hypothetical protein
LHLIRKDYKELLDKDAYRREQLFIHILTLMENKKETSLTTYINELNALPTSDNDMINYNDWLRLKTKKLGTP